MHVHLKMGNSDGRKYTNLKMAHTPWLSLAVALVTLVSPALSSSPRVVCYYTNWSVYRPGTAKFNPQNINPYLCTHLVYAFGGFTKDNTLKPFDKYQDIEKGGYAKFTGLKTYNKNLKTLLAIGGWNEGSSRFSPMVAAKDRRREFVRNVIKFLRQNHFDGLDLDWEYPAFRDGGKPKDRENYAKLVKELREEFERESEKTGKPRLLLTMAVPAGIEYIEKGFDVKTLNRYLDWMNLLTYDYHSAFEPAVNHHAPLYPLEEPNEYSVDNELNIDYTIKFYLENGADRDKLVLGIPTYGRSYTLFNPDAFEIGSPADGPGEQGDATREKGYLAYYEICEALKPKTKKRAIASDEYSEEEEEESEEEAEEEWTVMYPNKNAMGPVAYKGNQWVGYDDIDIVKRKAEYVAENGLGGIMFWSIDNDDFRGSCHGKPYPLIEAAKEAYIGKLGSTDITSLKDTPKVTNTKSSSRRRNRPKSSTTTTTTTTTTTQKPKIKSNKRKSGSTTASTTPSWNIITPEPPTTPDPGSDFKCKDEGFFPHPRDCKKYFWCLDSGPSDLGIVAHQFTCPSGLYFNKAADSCDFARNVLCKTSKPAATTKAPTKPTTAKTTISTTTTTTTTTTRRPIRLTSRSSLLFRTSSTTTTTPVPEPEVSEEESEEERVEEASDVEAEDPKVIKELIDLIKKVGGIEQLEKQLKLSETGTSAGTTDGVASTTPSTFNKKLYQRVLERARGKNKFGGNSITDSTDTGVQNSRRGPQNAGLEPAPDKDRLLRKDRPQYTTINRSRPSTSTTEEPIESEEVEEESEEVHQLTRLREEPVATVGTTPKPLQYVNIRRTRPSTAATEAPDESRNALFERVVPYVAVEESPNSLDILSARRENAPEYVTIRRSRPTTAETTTVQYQVSEQPKESQEAVLEREITSQSSQPLYTSVLRTRSTTLPPVEEPNSPEPTTVLSVQISSLLNPPNTDETERLQPGETQTTVTQTTELPEPETSTTSTTTVTTPASTTTSTTSAPSSAPTRRTVLRRRGSTSPTTTTAAPVSTTQVSSRNYSFIRRRRPLSQPNEISSESNESGENIRKIRSTTPDSRELDGIKTVGNSGQIRRFRGRFQTSRPEDSISSAASPVSRGQFRPQPYRNELVSLTPVDVETSEIIEDEEIPEENVKLISRAATTIADSGEDSEVSAATIDERRSNTSPRGRSRFSTTEAITKSVATESPLSLRRPTFSRFTPRPFGRTISTTAEQEDNENVSLSPRIRQRLTFARQRISTSTAAPLIQGRRLPYTSRQSTTQQTSTPQIDDDEIDNKNDDISLSESAIEEKEHDEILTDGEEKKLTTPETITETIPILDSNQDRNAKRKFKVIRRRPTTTTTERADITKTTSPIPRIRKVIRKKIRPADEEPTLTPRIVGFVNAGFKDAPKDIINYGEKTRATTISLLPTDEPKTTTENIDLNLYPISEILKESVVKLEDKEQDNNNTKKLNDFSDTGKTDIIIENDDKTLDIFENNSDEVKTQNKDTSNTQKKGTEQSNEENKTKNLEQVETTTNGGDKGSESNKKYDQSEESTTETSNTETETTVKTTVTSTTQLTSPSPRSRSPYRPPKKLFTSTTESTPSSSRTFSRKYNPGAYTSPSTVDRPGFISRITTRNPLFSRTFTRRTYPTARTTPKYQYEDEEEYSDEELLEEEPESPLAFVPPNRLFTRKPDSEEYEENEEEEPINGDLEETPEEETYEDEEPVKFKLTSKKPLFNPKTINSNTFRTSTSTTEIPRPLLGSNLNRTAIFSRFGGNKPVNDTKKRVQNVPIGYTTPKIAQIINLKNATSQTKKAQAEVISTTSAVIDNDITTTESDDYLTAEISTLSSSDNNISSTIQIETATSEMEIDNSTDDYLEYTTYPSTLDLFTNVQTETDAETETATNAPTTKKIEIALETTTELVAEPTTNVPEVSPVVKTQFDKLFSVSRVVEVSSKSEKHRLNKNNETTLIEEGELMIEKKPTVDKIGEVSRFSLIKIFEDEIPIYLTKYGHVYPVDNPPNNPIRIDEARNARALSDFSDIPKENLVASESMNEAYRHINQFTAASKDKGINSHVERIFDDDFLSYVNEEKQTNNLEKEQQHEHWQFVPAAYDSEKNKENNEAKSFEIVTPRLMLTDPSTLPLEALFKTETPMKPRKVGEVDKNKPFVVYSAPVPTQEENASLVKLKIIKPESGRSIITFAKGKEFTGAPTVFDDSTVKYPFSVSILQQSPETTNPVTSTSEDITTDPSSTTQSAQTLTTTSTESVKTSPIIELLTTTLSRTTQTDNAQTTESFTQTSPVTTETVPDETTTVAKERRGPFLRRTKATAPPDTTDASNADTSTVDTTTSKYTRRGNNRFKIQKTEKEKPRETDAEKPSLNGGAPRSDRPRNFIRRRLGGANATSTTVRPTSPLVPLRRGPFRVASRRRPLFSTSTTPTTPTPTTTTLESDESLQDIADIDTDAIEDPSLRPSTTQQPTTSVQRRRPLVQLKNEDQNSAATNEEEKKRQSKKYSSSFKQNQLDEILRLRSSAEEVDVTTDGKTTLEDISAETAVALAAHQLLGAPVPVIPDYDDEPKSTRRPSQTIVDYKFTSPEYTEDYTKTQSYPEEYTHTPSYTTRNPETPTGAYTTAQTDIPSTRPSLETDTRRGAFTTPGLYTNRFSRPTIDSANTINPTVSDVTVNNRFTRPTIDTTNTINPTVPGATLNNRFTRPTIDATNTINPTVPGATLNNRFTRPTIDATNTINPTVPGVTLNNRYSRPTVDAINIINPTASGITLTLGSEGSGESTARYTNFPTESTPPSYTTSNYESRVSRPGFTGVQNPTTPTSFNFRESTQKYTNTGRDVSPTYPTGFTSRVSRPAGFSPNLVNIDEVKSTVRFTSEGPSTASYEGASEKIPAPLVFGYSTGGQGLQEPSYFTREYLLESPVTKSYDDEYQYLSPKVTSPQPSSRRPVRRKFVNRRISTTQSPTSALPQTTLKPRRTTRKPFEKIPVKKVIVQQDNVQKESVQTPVESVQKTVVIERRPVQKVQKTVQKIVEPSSVFRPVSDYDYDEDQKRVVEDFEEDNKVILHGKGNIECLDIGNFAHPSSCKKFISCARMESGAVIGWEYICPKGLSFDPVGGICNWSAGLGCNEKDV